MEFEKLLEVVKISPCRLADHYLLTENQEFVCKAFSDLFESDDKSDAFFFSLESAWSIWLAGQTLVEK